MFDEQAKADLLASVNESIILKAREHTIIGSSANIHQIAGVTSGSLRIYPSIIKKFELILSQPISSAFNPFEIRCAFCKKVISYPCWYYSIKYAVNHFHYFVCFDASCPSKPSAKCYRRD